MKYLSRFAMVIEDDASFRATADSMLRKIGFKSVVTTEDVKLAWTQLNFMRFDFVLSNWSMERMDGLQLLHRVRKNPQLSRTCFVLMSADFSSKSRRKAIDAGATDVLLKPLAWRQLHETVQAAFGLSSVDQANVIKFPSQPHVRTTNARGVS